MISTHPLPEELAVLLKTALPPETQHRPLVGDPLHTCFQITSLPERSARPFPLCAELGALTAALQAPVVGGEEELTEDRSPRC